MLRKNRERVGSASQRLCVDEVVKNGVIFHEDGGREVHVVIVVIVGGGCVEEADVAGA